MGPLFITQIVVWCIAVPVLWFTREQQYRGHTNELKEKAQPGKARPGSVAALMELLATFPPEANIAFHDDEWDHRWNGEGVIRPAQLQGPASEGFRAYPGIVVLEPWGYSTPGTVGKEGML